MARQNIWNTSFMLLTLLSICSACSEDDMDLTERETVQLGTPIKLDFTTPAEDGSFTRATLGTDKTVFVTADEGKSTWYAYTYNTSTHLWEATKVYTYNESTEKWVVSSTEMGITWTSSHMALYAVVRNDNHPTAEDEANGESPITQPIEIPQDQSTTAKLGNAAVYGKAERVEFSTGRVTLSLAYIVAKTLVKVSNCDSPNSWTCTTTKNGDTGTAASDIADGIFYNYFTKGTIKIGDDKVAFKDQEKSLDITLCQQNANTDKKTVEFVSYIIPIDGPLCAAFLLTNGTVTNQAVISNTGGRTFMGGYTTTFNVTIKYPS